MSRITIREPRYKVTIKFRQGSAPVYVYGKTPLSGEFFGAQPGTACVLRGTTESGQPITVRFCADAVACVIEEAGK